MKKIISCILAVLMLGNISVFAEEQPQNNITAETVTDTVSAEESGSDTIADNSEENTTPEEENTTPEEENTTPEKENTTDEYAGENVINLYLKPRKGEGDGADTFTSLESVLSAIKGYDKSKNQIVVNISGGTYNIAAAAEITDSISGSEKYPVVFRAEKGAAPVFDAGTPLTATPIKSSDAMYKKFPASVRNKLYKIDLSAYKADQLFGIRNGADASIGSYMTILQLVSDNTMLPIASYPDLKYSTVNQVRTVDSKAQYTLTEEIKSIGQWTVNGYGFVKAISNYGYTDGQTLYDGINSDGFIKSNGCQIEHFSNGARVRFYNIPEILDQPGEYYFDPAEKVAYIYPAGNKFNAALKMLTLDTPLVTVTNARNIIFDGLTFVNGSNDGISMKDASNVKFKNCTVKNMKGNGFILNGCQNVTLDSCTISNLGLRGISLVNGGNLKKLINSNNIIENCDIYSLGSLSPIQGTGINGLYEVGAIIRNNRIHDTTAQAIFLSYGSNGTLIENNEFYNNVNDTYDAGAVYFGGGSTFGCYGNVAKNNYFHNIKLGQYANYGNTVALYWDDQTSGHSAIGNIFADNSLCMLVGGGDDETIKENIFYNSSGSLSYDNRGEGWQKYGNTVDGIISEYESTVGADNKELNEKYPGMAIKYGYAKANNLDKICVPDRAVIKDNLIMGSGSMSVANSAISNALEYKNNVKEDSDYIKFTDPSNFDFSYDKDTKLDELPEFEYIDFSKIGLKESKSLGKTEIIAPANDEKNIEGSDVVLSWKNCNGADKYRVQISMNKQFTEKIFDDVVLGERFKCGYVKYNKTFYWRVKAVKSSKAESGDGEWSDIYSFTTARSEKKDTTELDKLISSLGNGWRRVKEGEKPGTYKEGAIENFSKVVDEAETVLYDNASKMFEVKMVTEKLKNAIGEFNDKYNCEIVELGDWLKDRSNWYMTNASAGGNDNSVIKLSKQNQDAAYLGAQPTRGQLVKFKAKLDLSNFQAFAYNMQEGTGPFWNDLGYSLVIKRDCIEVQRRSVVNGVTQSGVIDVFNNNENILTGDVWYTIETGLLSSTMGPRILLKVNGKTVLDWTDTSKEGVISDLGYFGFEDGSQQTGMFIAGSSYEEN